MKFTTQKSVLPFKLPMQGKKNCLKQPILLIDPSLEAGIQGRGFEPPFLFRMSVHDLHQLQKKNRAIQLYNLTEQDKFLFFI